MKGRLALVVAVTAALGFLVVTTGARVATRATALNAEWGRVKLTRLSDAMERRLQTLSDDVVLTYYVTSRELMPSHMRRVERAVTDLLGAMERAAPERVDFFVVDPTDDEDLTRFASKRTVSPVRLRHVTRDAYSEQEVWSTLTISYGAGKPAMIQGVGPDHLPRLQDLIIEHLNQLESPRSPVFGLDAPGEGHRRLRAYLDEKGTVVDVSMAQAGDLPDEIDVLFWIAPAKVDAAMLRKLRHHLQSGRSVVVAGGLYDSSIVDQGGRSMLRLARNDYDGETLLGAFGVRPIDGLVLDRKSASLTLPTGETPAPFRIVCLALNQDFQSMVREPRGSFLCVAPSPFEFESERLAAEGWTVEVLAHTSDEATILPVAEGGQEFPVEALAAGGGRSVPKLPLLVWLRNVDPWMGSLVASASPDVFRDETFDVETLAHKRLTGVLIDTLAANERLVMAGAGVSRLTPLPPLAPGELLFWRVVVLALFPALLLAVGARRFLRRPGRGGDARVSARPAFRRGVAIRLAAGLVVVLGLAAAARSTGVRADLTRNRVNELAPASQRLAAAATGEHAVRVELFFSAPDRMPPEMRTALDRVQGTLREFERSGAELDVRWVAPEGLSDAERTVLEAAGVTPTRVTSLNEETTTVRTIYSSARMTSGDRVEILSFPDVAAFENIEFRFGFALWRMQTGRNPHVVFASDAPRLSSAESYKHYQSKGMIAPSGKDVYSLARQLMTGCDFRVSHVNPRTAEIPDDTDLVFWMQPRRSVSPMLDRFVEYMYRGGRAIVAAQHFEITSQQYRGVGFEFVYWPRPQSPDVETYWYPDFGALLVREVLFDAISTKIELSSQINRYARREFQSMNLAKPFLIRAASPNFARDSVITRSLGDQAFLFANHFRLDEAKLAEHGMTVKTLITTSDDAWSLDWKGGWIPQACLGGTAPDRDVLPDGLSPEEWSELREKITVLDRAPMMIQIDGQFPWPKKSFEQAPMVFGAQGVMLEQKEPADYPTPEPVDEAKPGSLLFIGCSEMFKDERMLQLMPEFRPDHLLLNSVAAMTLEPDLAEVMARRPVRRGLDRIEPAEKVRWRAFVYLAMPVVLVLFMLGRGVVRRRPAVVLSPRVA